MAGDRGCGSRLHGGKPQFGLKFRSQGSVRITGNVPAVRPCADTQHRCPLAPSAAQVRLQEAQGKAKSMGPGLGSEEGEVRRGEGACSFPMIPRFALLAPLPFAIH